MDGNLPNTALCIKSPFAQLVVEGRKTWELRSFRTHKRERIAIAMSQTQSLVGEVDIVDCIPLDDTLIQQNVAKHQVHDPRGLLGGGQLFAWVLESPSQYNPPKSYEHPAGAISWVHLNKAP